MNKKFSEKETELTLAFVVYLEGLEGIYFSPETVIEIYPQNPKYKKLFYWDEKDDSLVVSNSDLLNELIQEIHTAQIDKEFELLSEEGFCDKGVDKTGKMQYFPNKGLTDEDLLVLLFKRLDAKK